MEATAGNITSSQYQVCVYLPPNVHSQGIIGLSKHDPGMNFTLPMLELQMALIFSITQAFHFVLKNFEIPKFTCEILAGIVLGPSLLGGLNVFKKGIFPEFPHDNEAAIRVLGEVGYELFLFIVGVRMDLELIKRTKRKILITGILCVLAPMVTGMVVQNHLTTSLFQLSKDELSKLPYITTSHCMTSSPVIVYLLEDLNLLNSEIGRLAVSASSISELFGLSVWFSTVLYRIGRVESVAKTITVLVAVVGGILALLFIFRPILFWVIRQTPQNKPVKKSYVHTIIMGMLFVMIISHYYGHSFHFMVFLMGLAVPAGQPLGSTLDELLQVFISQVLLPIYVTVYAMKADLRLIDFSDRATVITAILIVFIFMVKLTATMVAPLCCKIPFNDAFVLALILSSKGIVQVSVYTRFRDDQTASESVYALTLASVAVTATLVPIIVKRLYDPTKKYKVYDKRNIMSLKPNAELKILACIHRSGNIPAVINLLDAACPSKENPVGIYVLHLIESIGRSYPVFISHQMQKKSIPNASYSDNVILYFNNFVRENLGAVTLNIFTAISPQKYMQEDVCTLALDKRTSLIVLPFHRTWAIDGSIESDDNAIRTLNCSVLKRAPCSVGILVDRGHLGRSSCLIASGSSFTVAMIFFGGEDDREALTFAKRMASDSAISLTVIRIVAMDNDHTTGGEWDRVLDTEILKEFRHSHQMGEGFAIILEELVKDGPQTALLLRTIVSEYDLIIVGRRHEVECPQTAGLSEWSDFPELGTIGDLLSSPDVNSRASILVIRHQQQIT